LEVNKPSKTFLLNSEILKRQTIQQFIVQLFENSMLLLWPEGIQRENILLFITDALHDKSWKNYKSVIFKMSISNVFAHTLHRVTE